MEFKVRSLSIILVISVLINCLLVPIASGKSEGLFQKETLSASQNPDQDYPVSVRIKAEISNFTHAHVVYLKAVPTPVQSEPITFTFLDLSLRDFYLVDNLRPPISAVS